MGRGSGRQRGTGSSGILRSRLRRAPRSCWGLGARDLGPPLSRGQAGEELGHLPGGPGFGWGALLTPQPQLALTEEAQPEPSGYKTDGDQGRCQQTARVPFTKSNLFSFPSRSPSPTSSPPSPFLQHRLAVTLMPGPWCGTAGALKVALATLGGSVWERHVA